MSQRPSRHTCLGYQNLVIADLDAIATVRWGPYLVGREGVLSTILLRVCLARPPVFDWVAVNDSWQTRFGRLVVLR